MTDRIALMSGNAIEHLAGRSSVVAYGATICTIHVEMIRSLADMRAIGPQLATLLVGEAFVRPIANRRALGAYVGPSGTPYSSGGNQREQGIGTNGNARV